MGFSLKKLGKAVTKVAKVATSPMRVATEAVVKGATWTGKQAGIPGAARADRFMKGQLKETIADTKTSLTIGAGVGLMVTGNAKGAALVGAGVKQVASDLYTPVSLPPAQPGEPAPITTGDAHLNPAGGAAQLGSAPPTFGAWLRGLFGGRP